MSKPTRSDIADEISGVVVGSGYYSNPVGIDAALEIAEILMSEFEIGWKEPEGTSAKPTARAGSLGSSRTRTTGLRSEGASSLRSPWRSRMGGSVM